MGAVVAVRWLAEGPASPVTKVQPSTVSGRTEAEERIPHVAAAAAVGTGCAEADTAAVGSNTVVAAAVGCIAVAGLVDDGGRAAAAEDDKAAVGAGVVEHTRCLGVEEERREVDQHMLLAVLPWL